MTDVYDCYKSSDSGGGLYLYVCVFTEGVRG